MIPRYRRGGGYHWVSTDKHSGEALTYPKIKSPILILPKSRDNDGASEWVKCGVAALVLHDEILSAEQSGARGRNLNRAAGGAAGNFCDQVSVGEHFEIRCQAVERDCGCAGQMRAQD